MQEILIQNRRSIVQNSDVDSVKEENEAQTPKGDAYDLALRGRNCTNRAIK